MRSVGYRQVLEFFDGHYPQQLLFDKALVATRQLAKRQITWLRKEQDGLILDPYAYCPDQLVVRVLDEVARKCKDMAE
jgi:tRNA dimethylallyltransferase